MVFWLTTSINVTGKNSSKSIHISRLFVEALQQFEGRARPEAFLFGLAVVDVTLVLHEVAEFINPKGNVPQQSALL